MKKLNSYSVSLRKLSMMSVSGKHDPEIVRNDEIDVNPISIKGEN